MAALADYADLRRAIVEETGHPEVSDVLGRLVLQTESALNQRIRHRKQITAATVTFTDGVAPLPADYLEMLHVYDTSGSELFATDLANQKKSGGQYRYYAIDDGNIVIYGLSGDRSIVYFAALPSVADTLTDSNWLLSQYPGVYVHGVAYEVAKYLHDEKMAAREVQLFDAAVTAMKIDGDRARYGNGVIRGKWLTP